MTISPLEVLAASLLLLLSSIAIYTYARISRRALAVMGKAVSDRDHIIQSLTAYRANLAELDELVKLWQKESNQRSAKWNRETTDRIRKLLRRLNNDLYGEGTRKAAVKADTKP